jgi:tetratricopeptide (TPR) repeat protein
MEKIKKEATEAFTSGTYQVAVEKFTECLELDPMNVQYNSNILFNRACAYAKVANLAQAIADLD